MSGKGLEPCDLNNAAAVATVQDLIEPIVLVLAVLSRTAE